MRRSPRNLSRTSLRTVGALSDCGSLEDVGEIPGIVGGVEGDDHQSEGLRRLVETYPLYAVLDQYGDPLARREILAREPRLPSRDQRPHLSPGVAVPSRGCPVVVAVCLGVRCPVATEQEQPRQGAGLGTPDEV